MSVLKRIHKFIWSLVDRPIRAHYFWMMKKSCLCHIDGVGICDMSLEQRPQDGFLSLARDAMALIKSLDPRRYRRVCRQLDYIVNAPLITSGNYEHKDRICNIDYSKHFTSNQPRWNLRAFACLLIHEATHGVVAERGIPYEKGERERIEKMCHREEYRFALRFEPGWADANIGPFDPERWKPYWDGSRKELGGAMLKRLREGLETHFKRAK